MRRIHVKVKNNVLVGKLSLSKATYENEIEISNHAIYTNLMTRRTDMIYAEVVKQ